MTKCAFANRVNQGPAIPMNKMIKSFHTLTLGLTPPITAGQPGGMGLGPQHCPETLPAATVAK